jgi:hypothetical protein
LEPLTNCVGVLCSEFPTGKHIERFFLIDFGRDADAEDSTALLALDVLAVKFFR